jgi:ferrous iron transport protein A
VPGAEFEVIREAPFGDPIEIRLQGASIALRKHEGDQLTVEELPG